MKAAALLLFLAFTAAQADQLDFWKHHSTGLAVVTFTYGSGQESHWLAEYQSDDIDLDHEDEFGATRRYLESALRRGSTRPAIYPRIFRRPLLYRRRVTVAGFYRPPDHLVPCR